MDQAHFLVEHRNLIVDEWKTHHHIEQFDYDWREKTLAMREQNQSIQMNTLYVSIIFHDRLDRMLQIDPRML